MYWKMWIFQMTQEIVRGTSNLLVANSYCMVAFKMHVFDALLFEETPNRSNGNHFYHVFSNTLKDVQECPPFI